MTDTPVGLTRAEVELEQQQPNPQVVVVAPPGAPMCGIALQGGDACKAAAICRVVWQDQTKTRACRDCAQRMKQIAESHRTNITIEPIG